MISFRSFLILSLVSTACAATAPTPHLAVADAGADVQAAEAPDPSDLQSQIAELPGRIATLQAQNAEFAGQLAALPPPATPTQPQDLSGLQAQIKTEDAKIAKLIAALDAFPVPTSAPDLSGYAKVSDLTALVNKVTGLPAPGARGTPDLQAITFDPHASDVLFDTKGATQMTIGMLGPATIDGKAYPLDKALSYTPV